MIAFACGNAAREACRFIQGRSREHLNHDLQLVWALVKAVEIIVKAAYRMALDSRKAWREAGYLGVTSITKRLLEHWRNPKEFEGRRFFFRQWEAVEMLI